MIEHERWTKEKTTILGTYREKRGRWHGLPYVISTNSPKGMTPIGWVIVSIAVLSLIAIAILEESAF